MAQLTADKDPLGPIDFVVNVVTTLLGVGLVFTVVSSIFDSGSGLGFGGNEVCASIQPGVVPWGGSGGGDTVIGLVDGARAYPDDLDVCAAEPTIRARFYLGLKQWPSLLFSIGFLLGLHILIRTARRDGMFTTGVARGVTALGWYLLVGAAVVATIQAGGNALLLQQMVDGGVGWNVVVAGWSITLSTLIGAFGMITFGRLLQRTVPMREELDATI